MIIMIDLTKKFKRKFFNIKSFHIFIFMSVDWTKVETTDIVIIGSGPGGSTAALYAARAGFKVIVLHGELPGGQLTTTTELENFPGWKGTGPGLVEHIEKQATEAGAEYRYEVVTKVMT